MPAPISVVIPTLNCAKSLGPTLVCVFDGVAAGLVCEVVFADGGSRDGLDELAEETGAVLVQAQNGRGSQLAAGVKAAKGEWVLVLHSDTVLSDGWVVPVQAALDNQNKAGYFRLRFDAAGFAPRFTAGWANLRSWLFGLPYGDQGLLISRQLYQACGGYPNIPLMEDVAIARALRGRLRALPITATTNATRYQRDGWFRRGSRNLTILVRYLLGADPKDLVKRYR